METHSIRQWYIPWDTAGLDTGGHAYSVLTELLMWLTFQVWEFSRKSPSILGCHYLSSFLSFCGTPDLGRWNKGAHGVSPSDWCFMDSLSRKRSTPGARRICGGGLVYRLGIERGNRCRIRTSAPGTTFQKCGGHHSSPLSTPKDKKFNNFSKETGLVTWYLGHGTWGLNFRGDGAWDISGLGKIARNCLYLPLYCVPVHSFAWQTKGLHIQGGHIKLVQN